MNDSDFKWKPIWLTAAVVTIAFTILGRAAYIIERTANKQAYNGFQTFFKTSEPDYFSLLYLLIAFFVVFAIVWVYRMILPQLPSNWIIRGILIGIFLFLVGDLLNAISAYYSTTLPGAVIWGIALSSLVNKTVNGMILVYAYMRFSRKESTRE
jgi:RsiW-degrading membrane proteinase PrsW (M82 family)